MPKTQNELWLEIEIEKYHPQEHWDENWYSESEVHELKEQLKEYEDIYLKNDEEIIQEIQKLKKELKKYAR